MKILLIIIVSAFCSMELFSQHFITEHTLGTDSSLSNSATIEDVRFLTGLWNGSGLGGEIEEQWSQPHDKTMLGTFRLIKNGKNVFYEIMEIAEVDGSLRLRVKHFTPEFIGWEEKDKFITFPLVTIRNSIIYFNGLTIEKTDKGIMMYLRMKKKDGSFAEEILTYTKVHN